MDSAEWNKIFMGLLSAALFVMLIGWFTETLFHIEYEEATGYPIEVPDIATAAAAAPVEEGPTVAELLADATTEQGARVFKKCTQCHSIAQGGANGTGPNLWNVFGNDIAAVDGFPYSGVMAAKEGNWTLAELDAFLTKPTRYLRGTKMSFAGLKKPTDRARVIKYLWENGTQGTPLPTQ